MVGRPSLLPQSCVVVLLGLGCFLATSASAGGQPSQAELLDRLKRLEENQTKLYELLKAKDARLDALEGELQRAKQAEQPIAAPAEPVLEAPPAGTKGAAISEALETVDSAPAPPAPDAPVKEKAPPSVAMPAALKGVLGTYEQGRGFGLAKNEFGEVNFGIYTYVRYLNQTALNDTYTNGLGQETRARPSERPRAQQGQDRVPRLADRPALPLRTLRLDQQRRAGARRAGRTRRQPQLGIRSRRSRSAAASCRLPTTRSTQGNFPYWLTVDHRTTADEFFRGSYTHGLLRLRQTARLRVFRRCSPTT